MCFRRKHALPYVHLRHFYRRSFLSVLFAPEPCSGAIHSGLNRETPESAWPSSDSRCSSKRDANPRDKSFFTATSSFEDCWTGTNGQGTLGALPLSYRPAGSKANRLRLFMDQVGFEPTSSRVVGEVTLSFTTSNSVAFRQIRAGRKSSRVAGLQSRVVSQTK